MPHLIVNKILTVLRYISPIERRDFSKNNLVPNEWLARLGLAIGNDLDKEESPNHIGTWISEDRWPVYVVADKSHSGYLMKKHDWLNPAGSVVYIADISLDELEIGANVAFCESGKEFVLLSTLRCKNGYWLHLNEDLNDVCSKLKNRFNEKGFLRSIKVGDEFFISKYKSSCQLENEHIYRSNGKSFIDVTSQVLEFRKK